SAHPAAQRRASPGERASGGEPQPVANRNRVQVSPAGLRADGAAQASACPRIPSFLAVRAVVATPAGDNQAFYGRATDQAGLAFAAIDAVLELEEAGLAFGVHVIGNRRAAGGDGLAEHLLDGVVKAAQFGPGERGGAAARAHSGAEKRFVRIDIAHTTQQLLVQQRALDRGFALAEQVDEDFETNIQRFHAFSLETVARVYRQPPEPPWINKAQFPSRSQLGNEMRVLFDFLLWLCQQKLAGHAQMNDKLG